MFFKRERKVEFVGENKSRVGWPFVVGELVESYKKKGKRFCLGVLSSLSTFHLFPKVVSSFICFLRLYTPWMQPWCSHVHFIFINEKILS